MNPVILRLIFRNAIRNKWVSLISIIGLSIGLACSILLVSWITHELSYDRFIYEGNKIFRVTVSGKDFSSGTCPGGVGPESVKLFPEFENFTRVVGHGYTNAVFKTEDGNLFKEKGYAVDSTFFNLFSYKVILGNLTRCLDVKNKIVIDDNLAHKLYGTSNPIGKNINLNGENFVVSAVIENVPSNSHLQFHFVVPIMNAAWLQNNLWDGDNTYTYLKLRNNSSIVGLESKITELIYEKSPFWKETKAIFGIQPLNKIHFSKFTYDYAKTIDIKYVFIFGTIALLVLLVACFNFANLFIATALRRNVEAGIKLTHGASGYILRKELFAEILFFVLVSFFIAIILTIIGYPFFKSLSGQNININFLSLELLPVYVLIIFLTVILSFAISWAFQRKFMSAIVLKKQGTGIRKPASLRNLVVAQFTITIVLISYILVINKQISYMKNKDLGFDNENIIYVFAEGKLKYEKERRKMKDELLKNSEIASIAFQSSLPSMWTNGEPLSKEPNGYNKVMAEQVFIDEDFFDLMKIRFIEGENVFKYADDTINYCILNMQAVKFLGISPPYINKVIYRSSDGNKSLIIKGVVADINSKSLVQQISPCIYTKPRWHVENSNILFKINGNHKEVIELVKEYCTNLNPNIPFKYYNLDETYDELYKPEENARTIISCFTLLTLIISSLGLLAMVLFISEIKVKEIGIRKVSGAKISEIIIMLNKDFLKWIIIAFLIATPIAWYAMHKWLENFAYKTELSWWIFVLAGLMALGIAILTVSWQTWRAARRNPVEALRYE